MKAQEGKVLHFYRQPGVTEDKVSALQAQFGLQGLKTELCFNVETSSPMTPAELKKLRWLLAETFEPEKTRPKSFLGTNVIEVGPTMNRTTPQSTNAVAICHACGLTKVTRLEVSRRYFLNGQEVPARFIESVYDRMTEMPYAKPLTTFSTGLKPAPMKIIPLLEQGRAALEKANKELGLAMDSQDFDYYLHLFCDVLKRNPTDVELFQLAQAGSEHCRHHFWKGKMYIDGKSMPLTLWEIVTAAWKKKPGNSIIAFHDNSSTIEGWDVWTILPTLAGQSCKWEGQRLHYHILFTAETHNFPSGVAPFPGAETGTGGRIRDVYAVGIGGMMIAGTAAYCVGGLRIPGYDLEWEHPDWPLVDNLATPLEILIEASNGASRYGNEIGEPVILGFSRSNEFMVAGQRRSWFKPIMFTGGIGQMDSRHVKKLEPQKGDIVIILGGPNYRIGMGGGAASSMIQGASTAKLDFNAVQRGDAEMEQKTARVINACIAMGDQSPILIIHDLGAGGNCNAIPEGVNPYGALINMAKLPLGDPTLSKMEIWGNESQERYFIVIKKSRLKQFISICEREECPYAIIGKITGDGMIVVKDKKGAKPVNLSLEQIFGKVPQKKFEFTRVKDRLLPLILPEDMTIGQALEKVLRLLSVGSKRFLTSKVDRSVTGLIAQQQCVGPLQLTLSDYAAVANSHFQFTGAATSIGERPIIGLVNNAAMARMSAAEAFTNLCWAVITQFEHVRFSANWMWAAKVDDEGARLYEAVLALGKFLEDLDGPAIDGGKDSLSMAAKVNHPDGFSETVKAPGTLVMSAYAAMPDIRLKVTPDLKKPGQSKLMLIDLAEGKQRLGGSALAQVYEQVGNEVPDVEDPQLLKQAFKAMQQLIREGLTLSGHDRSDGGLITCLLEMAFAGNCGLDLDLQQGKKINWLNYFFNEELGLVIEYLPEDEKKIRGILRCHGLTDCCHVLGWTSQEQEIKLTNHGQEVFWSAMPTLRDVWEETSYQIDRLQANPECVEQEREVNFDRQGPQYNLSFMPKPTSAKILEAQRKPKVAILRSEGSNGDAEMRAAFHLAGFEVHDVIMSDLISGRVTLDEFVGIVFVGGFSYADVLDAGKGWAGVIRFNKRVRNQFKKFKNRKDTFSLGICNGCQLMALLGWVPFDNLADKIQPRFIRNTSGRFESRFSTVTILESPAIMLQGMSGSTLGIWVAHGEGRFHSPDSKVMDQILQKELAPIRFVDDQGLMTDIYPFNPNGSPLGITALCDPTGRHLAMMPHPERCFHLWQWPYLPEDWQILLASPWLKLFQNAYQWCSASA